MAQNGRKGAQNSSLSRVLGLGCIGLKESKASVQV